MSTYLENACFKKYVLRLRQNGYVLSDTIVCVSLQPKHL